MMDDTRENGLQRVVAESLPPVLLLTAGVYALGAATSFFAGVPRWLVALGLATAAAQIALYLWTRRRPISPSAAHPIGGLIVIAAVVNVTAGRIAVGDPVALTSYVLVILGCSLLLLSWRWFFGMIALTYAAMAASLWFVPFGSTRVVAMTSISAGVAATAFQLVRLRTNVRYETIRLEDARSKELLEQSRRRYESLVEEIPVGVYRTSLDGKFLDVNTAAARILDFPDRESLLATSAADLYVKPEDRQRWADAMARDGFVQGWESELRRRDGTTAWIRDSAHVIRDEGGRMLYYEGVVEDITDRKLAQARLDEARKQMRERERLSSLGTLVAGVAHEINNPLTYIRGNVELLAMDVDDMLADPDLPAATRERLLETRDRQTAVLTGVDRVAHITASLKTVARAPSAVRSLGHVNPILESVLTVAASRAKDSIGIVADLRADQPVAADATELSQVFLNLILNAADAVGERPNGQVCVRSADEGRCVVIEVEDNGPGIAEDHAHKIFVPFHTTKPTGTGLGLSVSQGLIQSLGGRITFTSEPDRTIFRVELPAATEERGPRSGKGLLRPEAPKSAGVEI